MDIAALSIALNQAQIKQQAGLSVMKTVMATAETNAAGLMQMLKSSGGLAPHPYLGSRIDLKG